MGLTLASLALCLTTHAPSTTIQDPAPQGPEPLLSSSELKSLNKLYRKYVEEDLDYDDMEDGRRRMKAMRDRNKAREKFNAEWRKKAEKYEDLLGSMPDLRAIYADTFPYERYQGLPGQMTSQNTKNDGPKFEAYVPKSYDEETGMRTVLQLPGLKADDSGEYEDARELFGTVWNKSPLSSDTIFIAPTLPAAVELDAIPDLSRPGELEKENERIGAVLHVAGSAQKQLNFDRARFLLDCGRGSSVFGLRLATYFPDRFAGVILRAPEDAKIRYESLLGLPIALVQTENNKQFCSDLKAVLADLGEDTVTIFEATDAYPHPALSEELSKWAADINRVWERKRVVLAPNHDLFHKAYWVAIGTAEPLASVSKDDRPYLDAKVDRETNTITITTKSISTFNLLLNDDIVDLGKKVTVVVNGVAQEQLRSRQQQRLQELLKSRYDPTYLFTVEWPIAVGEN